MNLEEFFLEKGLDELVEASKTDDLSVNGRVQDDAPFKPNLKDLYNLYNFVRNSRRTTILEFGTGWSSLIFAQALKENSDEYAADIDGKLRRNNLFELHCVDDEQKYMDISKERISKNLQMNVHMHCTAVEMCEWNGRIATQYNTMPTLSPDLIYLDAPGQFSVVGDINGIHTRHNDMMPMSCDVLKFEHFLTPGTIIIVDGRAANARFLKANLQRDWSYYWDKDSDQHVFTLSEEPLGLYNARQMKFYETGTVE